MRKSIVMLFLNRFTLNDEEAEAITSRDVPIGPRFFEAMNKTERIRNDCRVLMSGEDGPTKAGYVAFCDPQRCYVIAFLQNGHHGVHFFLPGTRLREDISLVFVRIPSDGTRHPARS
jgi:hypothetical protein